MNSELTAFTLDIFFEQTLVSEAWSNYDVVLWMFLIHEALS